MPSTNHIKIGASDKLSLSKGNITVGVSGTTDYGPTSNSGFYNGITPPVGGYTIYVEKASQGPSIHIANDDNHCIYKLKKMGAPGATIGDVLTWALTEDNILVLKSELTNSLQTNPFQNVSGSNGTTGFFFGGFRNDGLLDFVKVGFLANGTGVVNAPVTAIDRVNQTITISGAQFVSGDFYTFSLDTSTPQGIISSGLILHVDANNLTSYPGTGTTWYDLSPNGYDATLSGNATYNSSNGGYIDLQSNTGYIDFGLSSAGSGTSAYTWGGWFNVPSFTSVPMARGNDMTDSYPNGWNLATVFQSNTFAASMITTVPGVTQTNSIYSSTPSTDTWYNHITVWNPGVSLKVYVNGVLRSTENTSATNLRSSGTGWNSTNSGTKYNVKYGSMVVYDTVLSDSDVLYNYNVTKTRFGL
jgi:hypothetical protein